MRSITPVEGERIVGFGPFEFLPQRQLLLRLGQPVRLGPRALQILSLLIERVGQIVSKQDIIAAVWPDVFVEDVALRVHIAGLRKALGEGTAGSRFLANVSGRGYQFVAETSVRIAGRSPTRSRFDPGALPVPAGAVIGRASTVAAIAAELSGERLITLVGAGGVGKTTVALECARRAGVGLEDGVLFVSFEALAGRSDCANALAAAVSRGEQAGGPTALILEALRDRKALLVLDGCEHVVESISRLTQSILGATDRVRILATSRQPLRLDAEHVWRLEPLGVPPASLGISSQAALEFAAVELFVERARSTFPEFEFTDADASPVAEICRRLDGVPLAIDIVASRIDAFGIAGLTTLARKLDSLPEHPRRNLAARHRSLKASLDWSFELLSVEERVVFRRIAVFRNDFRPHAAVRVISDASLPPRACRQALQELVSMSLVTERVESGVVYHRLLAATREYAERQLRSAGEFERISRRLDVARE